MFDCRARVTVTITHKGTVATHTVDWLNGSDWRLALESEDAIIQAVRIAADMVAVARGDIRSHPRVPDDAQRWPLGEPNTATG
jgi:hypothetical protein